MFLKALIFSTSLLFCSLNFISSSTVSCNFLKNFNWGFGDWYTCFMQTAGPIHSTGFNILSERRENVSGLSFYGNKNISFLPESVSEVFPNLGGYDAGECNVKAIFKANFERLGSVRRLELQGNQIEVLEGNVFQDLTSLIRLRLDSNRIKIIFEGAFVGLNNLVDFSLSSNVCIDKYFNAEAMKTVSTVVAASCGANENRLIQFKPDFLAYKSIFENLKKFQNQKESSRRVTGNRLFEIQQLEAKVSALNEEMKSKNSKIERLEDQITLLVS